MRYRISQYITGSIFLILLSCCSISKVTAQVQNVQYGKNREQFNDDLEQWYYYETDNLITYWYGKSREVGATAVKIAESEYSKIIDILEHRPRRKVELFVFSDLTDMNQSNIGIEDVLVSTQDDVKTVGRKVFVYFEEDYDKLKIQLREGIGKVIITDIFNPSLLQASLGQQEEYVVPQWFHQGLAAYIGQRWSAQADEDLKRYVQQRKNLRFKRLARLNPRLAGHSFWYFMETNYNRKLISNLVYLAKINQDLDDCFFYLIGVKTKDVIKQWENYYSQFYDNEFSTFETIEVDSTHQRVYRSKRNITDIYYTGESDEIIFIENKRGRKKLRLYDSETDKRKTIYKKGYVNFLQKTDYNYPLFAIDEDDNRAAIIYEHRDQIILRLYNLDGGGVFEQVLPERYGRINSFDFYGRDTLVLSAYSGGGYDLILYTLNNRQGRNLTSDVYIQKDVSRVALDGRKGVLFVSDRDTTDIRYNTDLSDLKRKNTFDVYFLEVGRQPVIYRITNTPVYDEIKPRIVDGQLYYLSDVNGIRNVYRRSIETQRGSPIYWLDNRERVYVVDPDTIDNQYTQERIYKTYDLDISLEEQQALTQDLFPVDDYSVRSDGVELLTLIQQNKRHHIYSQQLDAEMKEDEDITMSTFRKQNERKENQKGRREPLYVDSLERDFVSTRWDNFQNLEDLTEYLNKKDSKLLRKNTAANPNDAKDKYGGYKALLHRDTLQNIEVQGSQVTPYRTQFTNFGFNTSLTNEPLFGGFDSYSSLVGEFQPQPVTVMPKLTIKDLLENHVIEVGFRVPTTLDGTEVFVRYEDRRKKLDKYYAAYRRSQTRNEGITLSGLENTKSRTITLLGQYGVKYPLDIFQSLRARATLRSDEVKFLVADQNTSNIDSELGNRLGIGLEYVFDNAMTIMPNIHRGSKMKVYTEVFQQFELSLTDGVAFSLRDEFMTVVGLDLRHYINFFKYSALAVRLAGETSFGTENILNYLGGTDNWLIPEFDETTPQPQGRNFAFARQAPNLRGFQSNARNGSTYALINSEVRIPIFTYLGLFNSRINFLRNFQVIGFFDIGTAWDGINPFDDDNPLNTVTIKEGPVEVVARFNRDPVIYGYGFGARTTIFGYFLRADYAWGVESGVVQDPIFYISMGFDF